MFVVSFRVADFAFDAALSKRFYVSLFTSLWLQVPDEKIEKDF